MTQGVQMGKPHRSYPAEFKLRVVLELICGEEDTWRSEPGIRDQGQRELALCQEFMERAPQIFETNASKDNAQAERIEELERALGRVTLQLEIAGKVFGDPGYPLGDSGKWRGNWWRNKAILIKTVDKNNKLIKPIGDYNMV